MNDVPIVQLPGSETWQAGWQWGEDLAAVFPDQDASDFAAACEYNSYGPAKDHRITGLVMTQQGANDESNWSWTVTLDDGTTWVVTGGCDYTGWDCQSWIDWKAAA